MTRLVLRFVSMRKAQAAVVSAGLWSLAATARAEIAVPTFAAVFSDHAVVQRDKPLNLWGTARPNAVLRVSVGAQTQSATAGADGRWQTQFPAVSVGAPFMLKVEDAAGQGQALSDIVAGDVWLCSGQSNMELRLREAQSQGTVLDAGPNPNIRFLTVDHAVAPSPGADMAAQHWHVVSGDTARDGSAACYFMAESLQKSQGVPIGFIASTWGGSWIQSWLAPEDLKAEPAYASDVDILSLYARDAGAGRSAWDKRMAAWWVTADPTASREAWQSPNYNDTAWKTVAGDRSWENTPRPDFKGAEQINGLYWYRATITLIQAQADAVNRLDLGLSHGTDTTWINGIKLGETEGYGVPRGYAVTKGVFKAGVNLIAMRVRDNGGGGGPYMDPAIYGLGLSGGQRVPLPVTWRYRLSHDFDLARSIPQPPWTDRTGLGTLYNAMIAPLAPYGLKGIAWYQGESNIYDPTEYGRLLTRMRSSWRQAIQQPGLPFLIVQLPQFGAPDTQAGDALWAQMRDVQRRVADADPHSAYAVTLDIGDRHDIHPGEKRLVGQRLARAAQVVAYGQKITASGPRPLTAERSGDDAVVRFGDTDGGLVAYSFSQAIGFQVCDAVWHCRYVGGTVSGDTVVLKQAWQSDARAVRYAWASAPVTNLFSAADLPAPTFQLPIDDRSAVGK